MSTEHDLRRVRLILANHNPGGYGDDLNVTVDQAIDEDVYDNAGEDWAEEIREGCRRRFPTGTTFHEVIVNVPEDLIREACEPVLLTADVDGEVCPTPGQNGDNA